MKDHLSKYLFILVDFGAALIAWAAFFVFRKVYIENFPFEYTTTFFLGLLIIPLLWMFSYWVIGIYDNIYRKYRLQALYQTFSGSLFGSLILFFIFILDDTVNNYSDYYISFIFLFGTHFLISDPYSGCILNRGMITSKTIEGLPEEYRLG